MPFDFEITPEIWARPALPAPSDAEAKRRYAKMMAEEKAIDTAKEAHKLALAMAPKDEVKSKRRGSKALEGLKKAKVYDAYK